MLELGLMAEGMGFCKLKKRDYGVKFWDIEVFELSMATLENDLDVEAWLRFIRERGRVLRACWTLTLVKEDFGGSRRFEKIELKKYLWIYSTDEWVQVISKGLPDIVQKKSFIFLHRLKVWRDCLIKSRIASRNKKRSEERARPIRICLFLNHPLKTRNLMTQTQRKY